MNKIQKYIWITLLIFIAPFTGHSNSARYEQLVKEKQELIAELEKCTNTTKGLKIAGVSTLGLTAVGVAGNIYEASVINKNENTITQLQQQKDELKKELQK
ncbi:MAG: hypothetical protein IKZ34_00865, partial [Alphaproteobacteria bacterium]|nr:hypothetical protein [Alphaproteobacteria bacterium]